MDLSLQNIHMNMNYGLGELAPSYQVLKNRSKDFKWAWNLVNLEQYCHPRSHCFDLVLGKFRIEGVEWIFFLFPAWKKICQILCTRSYQGKKKHYKYYQSIKCQMVTPDVKAKV
jgi:hypothetical protein